MSGFARISKVWRELQQHHQQQQEQQQQQNQEGDSEKTLRKTLSDYEDRQRQLEARLCDAMSLAQQHFESVVRLHDEKENWMRERSLWLTRQEEWETKIADWERNEQIWKSEASRFEVDRRTWERKEAEWTRQGHSWTAAQAAWAQSSRGELATQLVAAQAALREQSNQSACLMGERASLKEDIWKLNNKVEELQVVVTTTSEELRKREDELAWSRHEARKLIDALEQQLVTASENVRAARESEARERRTAGDLEDRIVEFRDQIAAAWPDWIPCSPTPSSAGDRQPTQDSHPDATSSSADAAASEATLARCTRLLHEMIAEGRRRGDASRELEARAHEALLARNTLTRKATELEQTVTRLTASLQTRDSMIVHLQQRIGEVLLRRDDKERSSESSAWWSAVAASWMTPQPGELMLGEGSAVDGESCDGGSVLELRLWDGSTDEELRIEVWSDAGDG